MKRAYDYAVGKGFDGASGLVQDQYGNHEEQARAGAADGGAAALASAKINLRTCW